MYILVRIFSKDFDYPLNPEELIVCDDGGNVIYFSSEDRAIEYREDHQISSTLVEL